MRGVTRCLRRSCFKHGRTVAVLAWSLSLASPALAQGLKPPVQGLLDRQGMPSATYLPVVNAFVIDVNWKDLQCTPGGPISNCTSSGPNAIDAMLKEVRQINRGIKDPNKKVHVKLRVEAGINAPDWAKTLDGAPVEIYDSDQGPPAGTVGRFWGPKFAAAYNDLQTKLAQRYDGAPEVRDVVISRCTTLYAEPFIRQFTSKKTVANLKDAGLTTKLDEQCLRDEIDAHKVWKQTRSSLAFNPYQDIYETTSGVSDSEKKLTLSIMSYCRKELGAQCVLGNNSLRSPLQSEYGFMYDAIRRKGPPIYFQTATDSRIGDPLQTLNEAVCLGANAVELPQAYRNNQTRYPPKQLESIDQKLEQAPTDAPSPSLVASQCPPRGNLPPG